MPNPITQAQAVAAMRGIADNLAATATRDTDQLATRLHVLASQAEDRTGWHAAQQPTTDPVPSPATEEPPYAVLPAGLRVVVADALTRDDWHTAAYACSVLAGDPIVQTCDDPLCGG